MAPARVLHTPYSPTKDGTRDLDTSETRKLRSVLERFDTTCVSVLEWYRILRIHHEWTIFQAFDLRCGLHAERDRASEYVSF